MSKSHARFCNDYEMIGESIGIRIEKPLKNGNLVAGALVGKTQEHNSAVRAPVSVNLLPQSLCHW